VIPHEAVEALASVLAQEALVEADMGGYGWNAETDSPERFMPRSRERAREYLEAAAPHLSFDVVEEWAVRFGNVRKAEDKSDAEQKVMDICKAIQDGTESPHLAPPHIIHRYRVNETELTPWKPAK